ncbi:MAG: hypothetical protein HY879_17505 [Deltaproteobacteria bacterium]|nr:hypothetical protein [Deltaproteobacteria bacterium]
MDTEKIKFYLKRLSEALGKKGVQGEIVIYGGAAMVLVLNARPSTKDVDAVFAPKEIIYQAAKGIEDSEGAPENWLNDAVKGFISSRDEHVPFWDFPNLKVYTATPQYLLAMKCISLRLGRGDTDLEDIRFLIDHLGIKSATDLLNLVENYYPRNRISPKTHFAIEELFENLNHYE